jgi:uncharacterized SAM-binding protein YcdF (DUF218 family)
MFLLKKIISPFFMPVPACLLLALLGLFCLWFTRKQKTGKVFVTIATLFFGLLSYGAVSDMLARPLERKYPPITHFEVLKDVKWIVVLSGGASVDPELPLSTYLSGACLSRLLEGVCLYNRLPETKLILTGRSDSKGILADADVMADVAEEWGVNPENMVLETKARDTMDHAIYVHEIVGKDKFILVTSAAHMHRAMRLFRNQGMEPIPAPTDYMVMEREVGLRLGMFFPSVGALGKAGRAIHEYLGMVWAKLRGQI